MTIEVVSTNYAPVQPGVEEVKAPETPAAPEAKASEQNEAPKSADASTETTTESEESDDAETDESEAKSDDTEGDKPRKKGGFQRRIDKLNARVAAREQELEYWKQQAMSTKDAPAPKIEPIEPKANDGEPSPETFDTHAEYVAALVDWKTDQKLKARDAEVRKAKLEEEQRSKTNAHLEREKSFSAKTADYQEVIGELFADKPPYSPTFEEIVINSDHGPEMLYELAKNREEFARINALPPIALALEMGKLAARLNGGAKASDEKKPAKQTKAPPPIAPVGSKGASSEKTIWDAANLTQKEYEALRAKSRAG